MSDEIKTVGDGLRDRDVARLRASVREDPDEDLFEGRFEIIREAGVGGMGTVYEAIERATSRRVAIKVITGLPGQGARARFAAEIEILERLDHPVIVDYVAHGETSRGDPYLAMEWLVGESLAERCRRETLSIADAAILGERIADALDHAHRAGVVHRDLKPSNIFLVDGKVSEAHLIDFGVAKHADKDLTSTGQMIGTPGYMAPEQVRGDSINASADLFALGCVLYGVLAGRDAFEGAGVMEVLARLLLEDPKPIEALVPELPPRFAHLVGSLLSKDATGRLGDAEIACTELRAIRRALEANDQPALALRPETVPTPISVAATSTARRRPRSKAPIAAIVAGALAVAVLVIVLLVRPWSSSPDPQAAALRQKARAAEAAGKRTEALQAYLEAYAIEPAPEQLFTIAELYEATRQTEHALRYFRRYLHEVNPPDRAQLERRIGQLEAWYQAELLELGRASAPSK